MAEDPGDLRKKSQHEEKDFEDIGDDEGPDSDSETSVIAESQENSSSDEIESPTDDVIEPSSPVLPYANIPSRRPMPKSKRKELETKELLENAILIPATSTSHTRIPSPVLSSENEEEEVEAPENYQDVGSSDSLDETDETNPANLPEVVDIFEYGEVSVEKEEEEDDSPCAVDALGGVDVYKAQTIAAYQLKTNRSKRRKDIPPTEGSDVSSVSSSDLSDLASEFTEACLAAIKSNRKEKRLKAKRQRRQMEKEREEMLAKGKKDRFFDKSRSIPSAIYFNEIKVPLHVLYSYGEDKEDGNASTLKPSTSSKHTNSKTAADKSRDRLKKQVDRYVEFLKKCVTLAGIKGIKYSKMWKGCLSDAERIKKIVRLLEQHGLVGDPTLAKCRQIGIDKERMAEAKELDQSVIISLNERTMRSGKTHPAEDLLDELKTDFKTESD